MFENEEDPMSFGDAEHQPMFDMSEMDLDPLSQAFMREQAQKIGLNHISHIDQLAAAFIARYHCDPAEAEVVTRMERSETGYQWRTHIERRQHGGRESGQA
jgi:hypothetical protein